MRLALADVALATAGNLGYIADAQVNGAERPRLGNEIYGTFGRDFATADGERVMVVAFTVKQWEAIGKATGCGPALARLEGELKRDFRKESDRYEARAAIAAAIEPWFRAHTLAEVRRALDANGACWGPYQSFKGLVANDPRCSPANPVFAEVEQPGIGRYLMPGSPVDFGAAERRPTRPAPVLGADTDAVLSAVLGLTQRRIGELHDRKIVAGPQ